MNGEKMASAVIEELEGALEEYISRICAEEKCSNPDQAALFSERESLLQRCPALFQVTDTDKAVAMSEEESKKLIEYLMLQNRIEEGDLKAVYMRGIADGYRFFRRLGLITE